jgi:hypothetical protein
MTNTTIQTIANEMKATMNTMIDDMATRMQALLDAEYNERVTKSEEFGARIMELTNIIVELRKENEELKANQTVAVTKEEESLFGQMTPEQQEALDDLNADWDAHFGKEEEVTTEPVVAVTPTDDLVIDELPESITFPVPTETTEEVSFDAFAGFRDVLDTPQQEVAAFPIVEEESAFDFSAVDTSNASDAPEAPVEPQATEENPFAGFAGVMDTEAPKKPQTAPAVPNLVVGGREIAKKGEIKVTVYDVMGTEVNWIGYSRRINSHGNHRVREIALALNSVMQQGNTRKKAMTEDEKASALEGKYTTQMIREWAMEIAVANGIKEIGGDAGAAILVAEVLAGEKNGAALRIRNEAERTTMKEVYTEMVANPEYLAQTKTAVASFWNQFAYTPSAYAEDNNLDAAGREYLGTALIAARALNTMANVQGKRTVCVFPEVGKSFMSKKEFQDKMSFI